MAIGVIGTVNTSAAADLGFGPRTSHQVDGAYLTRAAQLHDRAGFDRVLITHGSSSPDPFAVAAHVLYNTERLGVLIAHRPGFVAPTQVARKVATLEHLTGQGRVALHHITGGSDVDQARDGDFIDKEARYRRTAEFMELVRRTLTSTEPFSFEGEFYRFEGALSHVRSLAPGSIPLYFGGQSDAAVAVGAQHADVFALWCEPLAATAETIARIRAEAARHGRRIEFSLSTRPVIAETEDAAWERAAAILAETQDRLGASVARSPGFDAVGMSRLTALGAEKDVHDERLFVGVSRVAGGQGNSTGHVGTAQQVADALLEYYDLGVTNFVIRGFDPLTDLENWGQELATLLRSGVAAREKESCG